MSRCFSSLAASALALLVLTACFDATIGDADGLVSCSSDADCPGDARCLVSRCFAQGQQPVILPPPPVEVD
jgi:hypothetical protein